MDLSEAKEYRTQSLKDGHNQPISSFANKIIATYARIRECAEDGIWISLVRENEALALAKNAELNNLFLRGRTFAIKDNIDLADLLTTAACPAYTYTPKQHADVVRRLIEAGAVPIGKTNLDQFDTGSSSGSAIAVVAGLVDFALGTDTAGSGRVPAVFYNLIGFKATSRRWS
ncbi:unnamed protein product, partial [Didymodactylos carnosus]